MSVVTVVLMVAGGILIYSGVSDKSPREIVTSGLKQSAQPTPSANKTPKTPPPSHGSANV